MVGFFHHYIRLPYVKLFRPLLLKGTHPGNGSTQPLPRNNASNNSFGTAHLSPSGSENTADGAHLLLGNVGEDALRCFFSPRDAPRRGYISTVTHTSSQAWPCFTLWPWSLPLPFYCDVASLTSCFPVQYLDLARWYNPLLGQLINSSIGSKLSSSSLCTLERSAGVPHLDAKQTIDSYGPVRRLCERRQAPDWPTIHLSPPQSQGISSTKSIQTATAAEFRSAGGVPRLLVSGFDLSP